MCFLFWSSFLSLPKKQSRRNFQCLFYHWRLLRDLNEIFLRISITHKKNEIFEWWYIFKLSPLYSRIVVVFTISRTSFCLVLLSPNSVTNSITIFSCDISMMITRDWMEMLREYTSLSWILLPKLPLETIICSHICF